MQLRVRDAAVTDEILLFISPFHHCLWTTASGLSRYIATRLRLSATLSLLFACTVFAIAVWLAKALAMRYTLKMLFMYKGWMYESRGAKGALIGLQRLLSSASGVRLVHLVTWNLRTLHFPAAAAQTCEEACDHISRYTNATRDIVSLLKEMPAQRHMRRLPPPPPPCTHLTVSPTSAP